MCTLSSFCANHVTFVHTYQITKLINYHHDVPGTLSLEFPPLSRFHYYQLTVPLVLQVWANWSALQPSGWPVVEGQSEFLGWEGRQNRVVLNAAGAPTKGPSTFPWVV